MFLAMVIQLREDQRSRETQPFKITPNIYHRENLRGQTHVRTPELPSPKTCGWRKSATQGREPLWTLLPKAGVMFLVTVLSMPEKVHTTTSVSRQL